MAFDKPQRFVPFQMFVAGMSREALFRSLSHKGWWHSVLFSTWNLVCTAAQFSSRIPDPALRTTTTVFLTTIPLENLFFPLSHPDALRRRPGLGMIETDKAKTGGLRRHRLLLLLNEWSAEWMVVLSLVMIVVVRRYESRLGSFRLRAETCQKVNVTSRWSQCCQCWCYCLVALAVLPAPQGFGWHYLKPKRNTILHPS